MRNQNSVGRQPGRAATTHVKRWCLLASCLAWAALCPLAWGAVPTDPAYDWDQWRSMPVLDGGRYKPLDTLAWETLRIVANRGSFRLAEGDAKLSPTPLYVSMLFEWQGWEQTATARISPRTYFEQGKPDRWDKAPIIRLDSKELRQALGFAEDPKYAEHPKHISPADLSTATFTDPQTGESFPFLDWTERLQGQFKLSQIQENGREVADRLWLYQLHRTGQSLQRRLFTNNRLRPYGLHVAPNSDDEESPWLSLAQVAGTEFNKKTDPTGRLREAQEAFHKARKAFLSDSPKAFNEAAANFLRKIEQIGSERDFYPEQSRISLEVKYNHTVPFRWAWVLTLAASLFLLLHMATTWRPFQIVGWLASAGGLVSMCIGFAMRVGITKWVAVTNSYEAVVYVAMGAVVLGVVFELISRRRFVFAMANIVATVALVLADNSPAVLDAKIGPLNPVLRSNVWLVIHVMSIMLSYAAFALAAGIANITLGCYLFGSTNRELVGALSKFTYRVLQFGVLLLAAGTVLGGVWADSAWGRFWGWDPKETWALIALLGYLAVLHARYIGWVRNLGLAVLSTVCFGLVMVAWFGVNFLNAGLHTYGSGGNQEHFWFICSLLLVQLAYAALAGVFGISRKPAAADAKAVADAKPS